MNGHYSAVQTLKFEGMGSLLQSAHIPGRTRLTRAIRRPRANRTGSGLADRELQNQFAPSAFNKSSPATLPQGTQEGAQVFVSFANPYSDINVSESFQIVAQTVFESHVKSLSANISEMLGDVTSALVTWRNLAETVHLHIGLPPVVDEPGFRPPPLEVRYRSDEDMRWFETQRETFSDYRGKHIAIYDHQVVGWGDSPLIAFESARKRLPNVRPLLLYVSPESESIT